MDPRSGRRRRWPALVCWVMFAAGVLLQLLGPHLKIANRAFVIPQKLVQPCGWQRQRRDYASRQPSGVDHRLLHHQCAWQISSPSPATNPTIAAVAPNEPRNGPIIARA